MGEFNQVNFLANKEKIDSIEKLLLVNVRLVKAMYEKGEDIFSLIAHIEILIEKSVTKIYTVKALTAYDSSVKDRADKVGIKAFDSVDTAEVLRHLCYDGTVQAQKIAYQKPKIQSKSTKSVNTCFAYNRSEGCRNDPCRYKHICSNCSTQGHTAESCKKGDVNK